MTNEVGGGLAKRTSGTRAHTSSQRRTILALDDNKEVAEAMLGPDGDVI
jgi:hypothetical protein